MRGIVDTHRANAKLIGQFHASLHGLVGNGLAEFFVSVPNFRSGKACGQHFDFRAGHPLTDF